MEKPKRKIDDLAYYLTLFKLKGHSTWRASLKQDKDGFEKEQKQNFGNKTEITDKMVLRIDRLTGTFSEAK